MTANPPAPTWAPRKAQPFRPIDIEAEAMRRSLKRFALGAWAELNPGRPGIEWGWYLDAVVMHLEAVSRGEIKRLLIIQPPNTLKSFFVSVVWPAWTWARDPSHRWLYAANESTLATRDAQAMRELVTSLWFNERFRRDAWKLRDTQDEKRWYVNTRAGHRISYSTNAKITGKKGDTLVIDDPDDVKTVQSQTVRDSTYEWITGGFFTRMISEIHSPIVVAGQMVHKEGTINRLVAQGGWTVLKIREEFNPDDPCETQVCSDPRTEPGEWLRPERFAEVQREERITNIGEVNYQTQHNANAIDREGLMFPRGKTVLVDTIPAGTVAVCYWDTAASTKEGACFSSRTLLGRTPAGRFLFIHHVRGRWTPGERNGNMRTYGEADKARTDCMVRKLCIERGAGDSGLERDANLVSILAGLPVEIVGSTGDKVVRAEPLSHQWHAGNVDVLKGDWNERFYNDMEGFPSSKMKDTTDSASGAFNKLLTTTAPMIPSTGKRSSTVMGQMPADVFDNPPTSGEM